MVTTQQTQQTQQLCTVQPPRGEAPIGLYVQYIYSFGGTPKARQPLLDRSSQNPQVVCIKPT